MKASTSIAVLLFVALSGCATPSEYRFSNQLTAFNNPTASASGNAGELKDPYYSSETLPAGQASDTQKLDRAIRDDAEVRNHPYSRDARMSDVYGSPLDR